MKQISIGALLLAASGWAQTQLMGVGTSVHLVNDDMAVLEAQIPRKDLPCVVKPSDPVLGFDLRFHAGYDVTIPLKELAGLRSPRRSVSTERCIKSREGINDLWSPFLIDDVNFNIVGDRLECDMGNAFVHESVADAAVHRLRARCTAGDFSLFALTLNRVCEQVEAIAGAHDARAC